MNDRSLALIASLQTITDHDVAPVVGGFSAQALCDAIVTTRPRARRARGVRILRRHRRAAFAGAAALAATAIAVAAGSSQLGTQQAQAAVAFHSEGDYIVADVTDPYASADRLRAAFRQERLDINVQLLPVSPSLVGTVVALSTPDGSDGIEALQGGACVTGGGGCPIGLRIPRNFAGHAEIALGRPSKSGEDYMSTASAAAPGEALHCSGVLGMSVDRAARLFNSRGLTVEWRAKDSGARGGSTPPASGYVWSVDPLSSTRVIAWTSPLPLTPESARADVADLSAYERQLNAGC